MVASAPTEPSVGSAARGRTTIKIDGPSLREPPGSTADVASTPASMAAFAALSP